MGVRQHVVRAATLLLVGASLSVGGVAAGPAAYAVGPPDLDVQPTYSEVTVVPRGDAETDRVRENRALRHSVLEPAGRYVSQGDVLTVTVPTGTTGMRVIIGQYGPHTGVNGGAATGLTSITLTGTTTSITSPIDGLVSLVNTGSTNVRATVTGGDPVPTFVLGETTAADFQTDVAAYTASPFAIVEGSRVVAAFQRATVTANLAQVTDTRVASWDDVVARTDAVSGLSPSATGLHRKAPQRIYIANPDTGAGYASATHDRVTFQVDSGAGAHLLSGTLSDQWGLWHEIGHTYQTPQYRWAGLVEVTVNISSLAIQIGNGWPNRLDDPNKAAAIAAYLAEPDSTRDYDAETNVWVKLAMFDGLREMFGDGFYPALNQEYRQQVADGTINVPTDDAKKQHFMVTAGQVAEYNLTDYFIAWGLNPSPATIAALSAYGPPATSTADLGVTLDAVAGGFLSPTIDYTLTVASNGPAASTGATVEVSLPSAVSSVANLPSGCTYASATDTVTCTYGSTGVGSPATRTFRASFGALAIGPLPATATRTVSTPADPNAANDTDSVTCTAVTVLMVAC